MTSRCHSNLAAQAVFYSADFNQINFLTRWLNRLSTLYTPQLNFERQRRFFGAGAPTAGGQIVANVTDDAGPVTLIEGAFLATED